MLTEGDTVEELLQLPAPAAALVTLSGGGKVLRGWAPADGTLLWERPLTAGGAPAGPSAALLLGSGETLAVATGNTVQVLSQPT